MQMAYNDFTEMPVWQSANEVVKQVYQLCVKLPRSEEYALSSQMKRAGVSIAANIAEAFGRNHARDKINFYLFARGSAFELRSHLFIAKDLCFLTETDISTINEACKEIIYSLNKIIKGLTP
jgi:four helix bundle protein